MEQPNLLVNSLEVYYLEIHLLNSLYQDTALSSKSDTDCGSHISDLIGGLRKYILERR